MQLHSCWGVAGCCCVPTSTPVAELIDTSSTDSLTVVQVSYLAASQLPPVSWAHLPRERRLLQPQLTSPAPYPAPFASVCPAESQTDLTPCSVLLSLLPARTAEHTACAWLVRGEDCNEWRVPGGYVGSSPREMCPAAALLQAFPCLPPCYCFLVLVWNNKESLQESKNL